MNILMLVDDLNIGGTATHVLSISKELKEKGYNIIVVAGTDELKVLFSDIGIDVELLDFEYEIKNNYININKIVYKNKIKIIHAHLPKSIEIASNLKYMYKINYVVTLHGMFYEDRIIKLCKNSLGIVCVSKPIKDKVLDILSKDMESKLKVIHNFINQKNNTNNNVRERLGIDKNSKIITYCSRLSISKGFLAEKFLYEFFYIAKEKSNVVAIVIGDGVRKRNIDFYTQSMNKELGRKAIYTIGSVYNPIEYFEYSCGVVGTGRVILEAMSVGVGCIALGSNGYAGIVEPDSYENMIDTYFGEHKLCNVVNKDFKESLRFILDDSNMESISIKNQLWYESNFNKNQLMDELISIYNNLSNYN